MEYVLRIEKLTKRFKSLQALRGLDLTVRSGSVLGLVGPNGSGKTTTFSIIAGLLKQTSGTIDLFGEGPFDPVKHKGRLSLLPQDSQLPKYVLVREFLYYMGILQGMSKKEAVRAADELLEWTHLTDRAKSRIKTLSHGMFRRLTIAQAFLGQPQLILLDEPTSGLDPEQVVNIRNLFLSRRKNQTIIISSHILSEIEAVCDEVAFIESGRTIRHESIGVLTEKNKMVSYLVSDHSIPLEQLEILLPDISFHFDETKKILTARFKTHDLTVADVNRLIISELFKAGIDLFEVHSGSDLESVYLAHSQHQNNIH